MTTERDRIQARADADAQQLKTVRMDLDAFLSLHGEERAARWRLLDRASKADLVIQQLGRCGYDWTEDAVAEQIAKYDQRWGGEPMPVEQAVIGALESQALDYAQHARVAANSADRTEFRRQTTAYTNALIEYKRGIRPEQLPSGAWLLPSRRSGEAPHIVRMDGDWVCSCKAAAAIHWPIALVIGCEIAHDHIERFDDGDVEPTPAELGRRLCEARSRFLEAA